MIDRALLELAGRQHGVLGVRQLIDDLEWSAAAVSRSRRNGTLIDVAAGVVRLASAPESFQARCMAAQLRLGGDGYLSGWTAGRLLGLVTPSDAAVHLEAHRCRGKDGVARFEAWLDHACAQLRPAQSNLERRLLDRGDDPPSTNPRHPKCPSIVTRSAMIEGHFGCGIGSPDGRG